MGFFLRFARFLIFEILTKTIALCFITTFVIYLLLWAAPKGEKRDVKIRASAKIEQKNLSPKAVPKFDPKSEKFLLSYFQWTLAVLKGDLGETASGQKVSEEIKVRLPVTFVLTFVSLFPALFISFGLGLYGQKRSGNATEYLIYLGVSLPAFFLGYFLYGILGANFFAAVLTLSLSCGIINEMGRIVKTSLQTEMAKDYMETARAKGLRETTFPFFGTIQFHAFRNAAVQIIPRMCVLFPLIISGGLVVEQIFRLSGLSYMLIDGLADKDFRRVLAVVLFSVLIVRIESIMANFLYLLLNPRYGQRL
jgi:ABC-type dipeptide/oligopeptide/nickel transport system permease component